MHFAKASKTIRSNRKHFICANKLPTSSPSFVDGRAGPPLDVWQRALIFTRQSKIFSLAARALVPSASLLPQFDLLSLTRGFVAIFSLSPPLFLLLILFSHSIYVAYTLPMGSLSRTHRRSPGYGHMNAKHRHRKGRRGETHRTRARTRIQRFEVAARIVQSF